MIVFKGFTVKKKTRILVACLFTFFGSNAVYAAPNVANGKAKFMGNCVVCHGQQGHGDGIAAANLSKKPANIVAKMRSKSESRLIGAVQNGKTGMPPFRSVLSVQDIQDIFAFIRSVNP